MKKTAAAVVGVGAGALALLTSAPAAGAATSNPDNPWCSGSVDDRYYAFFDANGPNVAITNDRGCPNTSVTVRVHYAGGGSNTLSGADNASIGVLSGFTAVSSEHRVCNASACSAWVALK